MDSMDVSLSELRENGYGQGGLACYDSWGRKESDATELNTHTHTHSHTHTPTPPPPPQAIVSSLS